MSDKKFYTKEEMQLIAAAAIASAPPTSDMTEEQWQRSVIRRAATIQRLRFLQEGSVLMNVLESVRIKATIVSVEYEESSTRYVVSYIPVHGDNPEIEKVRTPRNDTYAGRLLASDIEKLKEYAGTDKRVVIYKHNEMPTEEQIAEAKKQHKVVPTSGYRQVAWFDFIG